MGQGPDGTLSSIVHKLNKYPGLKEPAGLAGPARPVCGGVPKSLRGSEFKCITLGVIIFMG